MLCALGLIIALGLVGYLRLRSPSLELERSDAAASTGSGSPSDEADSPGGPAKAEPQATDAFVHVDGAVQAPGVYRVPEGARVTDAVSCAGGLAEDADTTTLNLAAPVQDGTKIHVPRVGEGPQAGESCGSFSEQGQGQQAGLVNVNTATREELETLSGVGAATAQAIIDERESGGPFESVDDLLRVSGIGDKKLARLREHVCV